MPDRRLVAQRSILNQTAIPGIANSVRVVRLSKHLSDRRCQYRARAHTRRANPAAGVRVPDSLLGVPATPRASPGNYCT